MGNIEPNDLRKAQGIMLDMLVEFDKICQKFDLTYWLDSGTLLGAVRHKGFIPWDDDIDISMPIEDYEKFQKIAQNVLSDDIFFQTKESDPAFKFDYIKLRSNRASIVEFHEKDREIEYHQGLFIDIFPMLTIPNSDFYHELYHKTFSLIRATSSVSLHTPNGNEHPQFRKKLVDSIDTLHQGWEDKKLKVIYSGKMPDVASWFDLEEIFPLKKIRFEHLDFYAPKNPHHYLSENYAFDYMQIPPENKRTIHAVELHFS